MSYTNGLDKPSDYFNTKLYTGTGSELAITGVGFQPDWVWTKSRSNTLNHNVYDSVRGVNKGLKPNTNDSEFNDAQSLKSFNSDGFTVGTDSHINTSSATFASWNWKAGTSFTNDASSTGIGSIDSAGSVNTDAGFSIVSYTGNSTSGATVGHGLGAVPKMILIKNISATENWIVYHTALGNTKNLYLDATNGEDTRSNTFNNTSPTSSVFSIGNASGVNNSGNSMIAYCFADVQGYSKFGSYTGNGNADGTFVYTGFKPAFVMIKRTNDTRNWIILDNKRNTDDNPYNTELEANTNNAEGTNIRFDSLSNGFKLRLASGASNASSSPYIYMAFAENPFTTSTGVPATAR